MYVIQSRRWADGPWGEGIGGTGRRAVWASIEEARAAVEDARDAGFLDDLRIVEATPAAGTSEAEAQQALADDRAARRADPDAARAWDHEAE